MGLVIDPCYIATETTFGEFEEPTNVETNDDGMNSLQKSGQLEQHTLE